MWGGCATFIPGDNGKVYISGGYQDSTKTLITNKIYAYDFSIDDYELIGETPDTPLGDHACTGLLNDQGAKYLFFFSSRSLKTREKYISFAQLVFLIF